MLYFTYNNVKYLMSTLLSFQDGKLTQVARPNPPNFGPGFVSKFSKIIYAFSFWFEGLSYLDVLQGLFLMLSRLLTKYPFSSFRQCSEGSV